MQYLEKLLMAVKQKPETFTSRDVNFVLGLTTTQTKDVKKHAIENSYIEKVKNSYYLTKKGKEYLQSNPIQQWKNDEFPNRPNVNLEYLKLEKTPPTLTKGLRNLAKHLFSNEELKEYSIEDFLLKEIESGRYQNLLNEVEEYLLGEDLIRLSDLFEKFSDKPYGLTRSIISLMLLVALSKNINKIAVYKKTQFTLDIDYLVFDRMVFCPQNFELRKTIYDKNSLLYEISGLLLKEKSDNILNLTKGLIKFVKSLENYTLNTEKLRKKTLSFRNVVMNAKDPITLFCRDIPMIISNVELGECGMEFVSSFREILDELKNTKPKLTNDLKEFMLETFKSKNKEELAERFEKVREYISDKELKVLCNNVTNLDRDDLWIDRIATFINKSRVPMDWSDGDVSDFKVKLSDMAIKFFVLESSIGDIDGRLDSKLENLLEEVLSLPLVEKKIFFRRVVNG